jgi:hypothetical protein
LLLLAALLSSHSMKVAMVNSLGRAPESPLPDEGAGEATAEAVGVEEASDGLGAEEAIAEAVEEGVVGLVGVAGVEPDPEPAPNKAGPGIL